MKKHPGRAETMDSVEPWEEHANPSSSSYFKVRIINFKRATLLVLRPKLRIFGLICEVDWFSERMELATCSFP